jgi:hypothetical protein
MGRAVATGKEYTGVEKAIDYFNECLFDGALPDVLVTYQRKAGSCGYYSAGRFVARDGSGKKIPELALNPAVFEKQTDLEILQTLVHELCHHWQEFFGKKSRAGYHNKEWAAKMEATGLMPSSTGQAGGNKVGNKMSDYVIEGGPFEKKAKALLAKGFRFNFNSVDWRAASAGTEGEGEGETKPRGSKIKYACPCGQKAWGKPGLALVCGLCGEGFEEQDGGQ